MLDSCYGQISAFTMLGFPATMWILETFHLSFFFCNYQQFLKKQYFASGVSQHWFVNYLACSQLEILSIINFWGYVFFSLHFSRSSCTMCHRLGYGLCRAMVFQLLTCVNCWWLIIEIIRSISLFFLQRNCASSRVGVGDFIDYSLDYWSVFFPFLTGRQVRKYNV